MTAPPRTTMRERLRTDYRWTERQREALDLLARGKTNAEIGEALGLQLPGVKWHVSEILPTRCRNVRRMERSVPGTSVPTCAGVSCEQASIRVTVAHASWVNASSSS